MGVSRLGLLGVSGPTNGLGSGRLGLLVVSASKNGLAAVGWVCWGAWGLHRNLVLLRLAGFAAVSGSKFVGFAGGISGSTMVLCHRAATATTITGWLWRL